MSETSRRNVIAVAGAGAAVGAAALMGGGAASAARPRTISAQEPLVAYVEDHRSDRVTLMIGEDEVVVRDRDLVTRLLAAMGGK